MPEQEKREKCQPANEPAKEREKRQKCLRVCERVSAFAEVRRNGAETERGRKRTRERETFVFLASASCIALRSSAAFLAFSSCARLSFWAPQPPRQPSSPCNHATRAVKLKTLYLAVSLCPV